MRDGPDEQRARLVPGIARGDIHFSIGYSEPGARIDLTSLQAGWRMSAGLDATEEVSIAKWWAVEAGHRVLHAAYHLHDGTGIDLCYPRHRYFLLGKQIEFSLGNASQQLSALGRPLCRAA